MLSRTVTVTVEGAVRCWNTIITVDHVKKATARTKLCQTHASQRASPSRRSRLPQTWHRTAAAHKELSRSGHRHHFTPLCWHLSTQPVTVGKITWHVALCQHLAFDIVGSSYRRMPLVTMSSTLDCASKQLEAMHHLLIGRRVAFDVCGVPLPPP